MFEWVVGTCWLMIEVVPGGSQNARCELYTIYFSLQKRILYCRLLFSIETDSIITKSLQYIILTENNFRFRGSSLHDVPPFRGESPGELPLSAGLASRQRL